MAAQLDFYKYDEITKVSTILDGEFSLGDIFKGTEGIGSLRLYNSGNKTAVKPVLTLKEFEGNDAILNWKGLSFSRDYDFTSSLELENVAPGEFATGKNIYVENFDSYDYQSARPIAGEDWKTWNATIDPWYAYSKSLYRFTIFNSSGQCRYNFNSKSTRRNSWKGKRFYYFCNNELFKKFLYWMDF